MECYNISGEFDFMLKVMAENMDAYYDFHVNKLSQEENIGHVQSVFVMGIIKQTHVLGALIFLFISCSIAWHHRCVTPLYCMYFMAVKNFASLRL